jgi:4-hydroxybenzoate polyprenyltransferase
MVSNKITALATLTILPVYVLIEIYDVGYMDIYFIPVWLYFLCSLLVEF